MSTLSTPPFGKLRSFFWPVHRHELRVLLPMLLMFFLITFNYNLLRIAKDALVVTARSSGADAIPFLKTWAILPMAFLVTFLFTRLSNRFKFEHVFYLMIGLFLAFFGLFAFFLYPIHDSLHPHHLADRLEELLPIGCHGLVAVFRNWTFTAFYVMAELWGTAIMTVLFWGFANQITTVDAAKRFYAILSIGGNASSIFSGTLSTLLSRWGIELNQAFGIDPWWGSVLLLTGAVFTTGLTTLGLFRWVSQRALKDQISSSFQYKEKKSTVKMGLRKSFSYLAKSPYLICIALIVLTYNIAINLTEVVWKDQLRLICPDPNIYQAHMGKVSIGIGATATIIALFTGVLLRRFNWTLTALIAPFTLLFTAGAFFSFLLFKDTGLKEFALFFGTTPLTLGVLCGSVQNCLSRASKYTLFDTTKELAFIPLDQESKLKGKAAIDGVGSRLGKSGSALIYFFLLLSVNTVSASIPYVALILLGVIAVWMLAVRSLGFQFDSLMQKREKGTDTTLPPSQPKEEPAEVPT